MANVFFTSAFILEAARIIPGLPVFTKTEFLYNETGWETLSERRRRRKPNLFYNIQNGNAPDYTATLVQLSAAIVGCAKAVIGNAPTDPLIQYTCSDGLVDNMTISDGDFQHIRIFNTDGTLCGPAQQNKTTVLSCIKTFKASTNDSVKVKNVTLIYEDITHKGIVGGKNLNYYILSCTEKPENKTAFKAFEASPTVPQAGTTLFPQLNQQLQLEIKPDHDIYIGTEVELELSVTNAETHSITGNPNCRWQSEQQICKQVDRTRLKPCTQVDTAIVPEKLWKAKNDGKLNAFKITMYAFKYDKETTVNIKCSATVCPQNDKTACQPKSCTRRRRSIEVMSRQQHSQKYASVSFEVSQNGRPTNKSPGLSDSTSIHRYGMFFAVALMALQL